MFYILDLTSLETIETPTNNNVIPSVSCVPKKVDVKDIVIGSTIRSRNGCIQCRKRKKKCDERYPRCGSCKHRNVECNWRDGTQFRILRKKYHKPNKKIEIKQDSEKEKVKEKEQENEKESQPEKESEPEEKSPTNESIDNWLVESITTPELLREDIHHDLIDPDITQLPINLDEFLIENFSLVHQPSVISPIILDNKQSNFLDAFINKVAKDLCIAPECSNYFLKTFYELSQFEESISYLIIAWGGLFIEGYTDDVKSYMNKSSSLIEKKYQGKKDLSKSDIYVLLNYYLIYIGVYVCSGDVSNWYVLFEKLVRIIQENGGLNHIVKIFNYSNDIKWLISDLQYHDIMSNITFSQGTKFPMIEYNELFTHDKILELDDYGLDPFQGCIQPIYLLLGDIITTSVELTSQQNKIDEDSRLEYYQLVIDKYEQLEKRLTECHPNLNQMQGIKEQGEIELHLTLFETYSLTCQLCMNYLIRKIPAKSVEMQSLLLTILKHIDVLIDTKLMTSLAFPLLICGITCSFECDRLKMIALFNKLSQDYKVASLTRMFKIVEQVWQRNLNGQIYVDWNEICKENNWHLSMC
ncbi:hypothetical protein JA1_002699 [Spathaspora sp. JA1]|nr:hypothetical protein JA1_002699 [Spathaspora sp. JA1]